MNSLSDYLIVKISTYYHYDDTIYLGIVSQISTHYLQLVNIYCKEKLDIILDKKLICEKYTKNYIYIYKIVKYSLQFIKNNRISGEIKNNKPFLFHFPVFYQKTTYSDDIPDYYIYSRAWLAYPNTFITREKMIQLILINMSSVIYSKGEYIKSINWQVYRKMLGILRYYFQIELPIPKLGERLFCNVKIAKIEYPVYILQYKGYLMQSQKCRLKLTHDQLKNKELVQLVWMLLLSNHNDFDEFDEFDISIKKQLYITLNNLQVDVINTFQ